MSPKWAKKAHFGDIFYNVFNRKKSSYLMTETQHFTISWRMGQFNESNHQNWAFDVYSLSIHKNQSVRFWCYRVYILINFTQIMRCVLEIWIIPWNGYGLLGYTVKIVFANFDKIFEIFNIWILNIWTIDRFSTLVACSKCQYRQD